MAGSPAAPNAPGRRPSAPGVSAAPGVGDGGDGDDLVGKKHGGFNPVKMMRTFVRNFPWFAIAIGAHVIFFMILGIWHLGHDEGAKEDSTIFAAGISQKKPVDEVPVDEPEPEPEPELAAIPDNVEAEVVSNEVAQLLPQDLDPNRDLTQEIGDPNSVSDLPDSDPTGGTPIGVGTGGGHRGSGTPSTYSGRRLGSGVRKGVRPNTETQGTEEAVRLGLIWLARHQNIDGSWSAKAFSEHCPSGKVCMPEAGPESEPFTEKLDPGLTGLSLLAFLGAGYAHNTKQFFVDTFQAKKIEIGKDVVLKGLKWLTAHQNVDGSFSQPDDYFIYNDAIAALALCEAYGLSQNRVWKEPAQKAIDFLCAAQKPSPDGKGKWGWRYTTPAFLAEHRSDYSDEKSYQAELSKSDPSVTGWCVMALKSAVACDLKVPQEAFDGAIAFTKWISNANGLVGYLTPDAAGVTVAGPHELEFKYFPTAMASVAMCVRVFLEHNIDDPYLKLSADQLMKNLPDAKAEKGKNAKSNVDYYYWYYGSLALNQLDGPDSPKRTNKYWPAWNKAMTDSLLSLQTNEEKTCANGGFLAPDRWCYAIGPVYTTALNVLTLEVYYRYENAFGAAANKRLTSKKSGGKSGDKAGAGDASDPADKPISENK